MKRIEKLKYKNFVALFIFGVAFGFVESVVVYYLRHLANIHQNFNVKKYHTILNLGFIAFIKPLSPLLVSSNITNVEFIREAATIIMLLAVSFIVSKSWKDRIGAFLIAFSVWDIFYYVFLKILTNWPSTFFTKDVYFLIPVVWVGPVITPLVISLFMFLTGSKLYLFSKSN